MNDNLDCLDTVVHSPQVVNDFACLPNPFFCPPFYHGQTFDLIYAS